MLRGTLRLARGDGHAREAGVRGPLHARHRGAGRQRLLEQPSRLVELTAALRDLRGVEGHVDEVAGPARNFEALRLVVDPRRLVPLAELRVRRGEIAGPDGGIRLEVR